ncbi:MAG: precorrin-6A/cobalt-precorrin-6A reductase [Cyanobium sp.]
MVSLPSPGGTAPGPIQPIPLRPRLWLIAGTGEGPPLARRLLQRGWRLRVSVVTAAAAQAYGEHPALQIRIGALGRSTGDDGSTALQDTLEAACRQHDPFHWVVDASHPFAVRISAALARVCQARQQPLLRLQRPLLPSGRARLLSSIGELGYCCRPGEALLLAIGARHLGEAIAACPQARHHGRVLPYPTALRQALAAGLRGDRLACLRPGTMAEPIEAALCRRWGIETVLTRQSGGESEARWHRHCQALNLRLLLLRRPEEPPGVTLLPMDALLDQLGTP